MRALRGFRYFLGVRPDPQCYPQFQQICDTLGVRVRLDLLHLTFCVIAQTARRDHFVRRRVQRALCGVPLHAFPVNLSRVVAGPQGAFAHTFGRQDEIQDFYCRLVRLLRARGIEPQHRKSGLHPHVTLAYRACHAALSRVAIRWFATELLLVESELGLTRHNVLERWSLLPPRQSLLPLDHPLAAHLGGRAIAG